MTNKNRPRQEARQSAFLEKLLSLEPHGRTIEELEHDLGITDEDRPLLLKLLKEKTGLPEGYLLFPWKNEIGREYFEILPPPEPVGLVIPPRTIRLLRQPNSQPYLRVFIPDDIKDADGKPAKFLDIKPIWDVHLGHKCCDYKTYRKDVNEIKENPNRFAIIGGDLLENALGDSAGGGAWAEQNIHPREQREYAKKSLACIAESILCAIMGNHEARSERKVLWNPMEDITSALQVPYFDEPVDLEIIWRGYRWTFRVSHGRSGANTIGGKLIAAGRARTFNDFRNFYIMGHVHDSKRHAVTRIVCKREFKDGKLASFWTEKMLEYKVICPAYLKYNGSYAAQAEYRPGSNDAIIMRIFANGDYRVVSIRRHGDGEEEEFMF